MWPGRPLGLLTASDEVLLLPVATTSQRPPIPTGLVVSQISIYDADDDLSIMVHHYHRRRRRRLSALVSLYALIQKGGMRRRRTPPFCITYRGQVDSHASIRPCRVPKCTSAPFPERLDNRLYLNLKE